MADLKVGIDASGARRGAQQFSRSAEDIRRKARGVDRGVQGLGRTISTVTSRIFSWQSAMGAAAGAAGLGYLIDRTLESTQQLEKMSRITGISAERIQELDFAAQQAGVSQDRMRDAIGELAQRMGEAEADFRRNNGTVSEMGEGFRAAGLEIEGLASRNPSQVLNEVADAIESAETQSKALNIAVKTFGDEAGREMLPILRQGSDGLNQMANEARELGLVLSNETVEGGAQAARELDRIKQVLTAQFTRAVADLGPDITEFTSQLADNTDQIAAMAEALLQVARAAGTVASTVVGGTQGMARELAEATGPNIDRGTAVGEQIRSRLQSRREERERLQGLLASPGATPENVLAGYRDRLAEVNRQIQSYNRYLGRAAEREQEAQVTGGGRGRTPQDFGGLFGAGAVSDPTRNIDVTGIIDVEAARERADEFTRIWAQAVRRQKSMHESVASENAEAYRTLQSEWERAQSQFSELEEQTTEGSESMATTMENAIQGWGNRFSSELNQALWSSENTFDNILKSFSKMLTQMIIQKQIVQPLLSNISFGGGTTQAHGGVWEDGVQKFATGGVVSQPTLFPMSNGAGLMGEDGPEAIMPLERTRGGDLGVKAQGMGGNVEVNVINNSGANATTQESQTANGGRRIDVIIDGQVANLVNDPGSKTHQALTRSTTAQTAGSTR